MLLHYDVVLVIQIVLGQMRGRWVFRVGNFVGRVSNHHLFRILVVVILLLFVLTSYRGVFYLQVGCMGVEIVKCKMNNGETYQFHGTWIKPSAITWINSKHLFILLWQEFY